MSTPLHMLDFHWWVHVAPGLDAVYATTKPFVHHIPFEGYIYETMLPRLWFVHLDQSTGGYFLLMAGLCLASQALFIYLLFILLNRVLGTEKFVSALLACAIAVTNLGLLQLAYPSREPGPLRNAVGSALSAQCCFSAFMKRKKHLVRPIRRGRPCIFIFLRALVRAGGLCALAGVMILNPSRLKHKTALACGTFGLIAAVILVLRIPLYMFFHPSTPGHDGNRTANAGTGGRQAYFFGPVPGSRPVCLSLPQRPGRHAAFSGHRPYPGQEKQAFRTGLYFFIATFFMTISGGQRLFGERETLSAPCIMRPWPRSWPSPFGSASFESFWMKPLPMACPQCSG